MRPSQGQLRFSFYSVIIALIIGQNLGRGQVSGQLVSRAADDAYKRNRTESLKAALPRTTGGRGISAENGWSFCCCSRSTGGTWMGAEWRATLLGNAAGGCRGSFSPTRWAFPFPDLPDWCKGRWL